MVCVSRRWGIRNTSGVAPGGGVKRGNDGLSARGLLGHQEAAVRCQQNRVVGSELARLRQQNGQQECARRQQERDHYSDERELFSSWWPPEGRRRRDAYR